MAAVLMNKEELKQWILRRLGAPFIDIELTADHLDDCVEQAVRWFCARKGVQKQQLMYTMAGKSDYALPDEIDTVTSVDFSSSPMDINLVFDPLNVMDGQIPYDAFAAPASAGIYSSFTQVIQYNEAAKRVLSVEPDWRQEDRTLYIFPVPRANKPMMVYYRTNVFTIEQLREVDHDYLKRYALAVAKEQVGRVRSKYSNTLGAQGGRNLDGERLLAESQRDITELTKAIDLSGYPIGIIRG